MGDKVERKTHNVLVADTMIRARENQAAVGRRLHLHVENQILGRKDHAQADVLFCIQDASQRDGEGVSVFLRKHAAVGEGAVRPSGPAAADRPSRRRAARRSPQAVQNRLCSAAAQWKRVSTGVLHGAAVAADFPLPADAVFLREKPLHDHGALLRRFVNELLLELHAAVGKPRCADLRLLAAIRQHRFRRPRPLGRIAGELHRLDLPSCGKTHAEVSGLDLKTGRFCGGSNLPACGENATPKRKTKEKALHGDLSRWEAEAEACAHAVPYGSLCPILSRLAAMYLALCSWIGPTIGT